MCFHALLTKKRNIIIDLLGYDVEGAMFCFVIFTFVMFGLLLQVLRNLIKSILYFILFQSSSYLFFELCWPFDFWELARLHMSDRMLSPLVQIFERYPLLEVPCAVRFSQLHLLQLGVHLTLLYYLCFIFLLMVNPLFIYTFLFLHLAHLQLNAWSNLILLHLYLPFIHIVHLPRLKNRLTPLGASLIWPRKWQSPGSLTFFCVACSQCWSAVVCVTLLQTFGVLWVESVFERVAYKPRFVLRIVILDDMLTN